MKTSLPSYIKKYFWGDDLSELNWKNHQEYISKIILKRGDLQAVSWLLKKVDRDKLAKNLSNFELDPKSYNFWKLRL